MIVGVVTDFEMTFTGDLFKVAWQNKFCFQSFNTLRNKLDYSLLKNSGEQSKAILALLLSFMYVSVF